MVNFRRVVTVFAVLALFTGLAFAQQENCSAQATNSTPLRGEGFTEQTGDIIINCVGGQPLGLNANIPLVNIQVFYNTTVTSRLLPIAASNQTSEALLIIDEPNTNPLGLPVGTGVNQVSYGQTQGMNPCLTPLTGCIQTVGPTVNGFSTAAAPAYNVYQGVVNGNSVTFFGVPVLPPTTIGSRVYRITNVRVNANQVSGGSASGGTTPVQAFITVSGSAALPISNSQPIVGYIQNGLSASVGGAKTYQQCSSQPGQSSQSAVSAGIVKFTENFGTAFKTRVFAQTNSNYAGQAGVLPQAPAPLNQDTPGGIYNSESNFVYSGAYGANGYTAGLADFGTRLKATFNNIPPGVRVFVQTQNTGANAAALANPGGSAGNATVPGYTGLAYLVSAETLSDGSGTGILPSVTATDNAGGLGIAEVSISGGTGTAVWEVVNTNPNTIETFAFPIYIRYTAAAATNTPLPGTSTVTVSFAPTATSGAASSNLPIPRFSSGNAGSGSIFTINTCRTILLYPYITNQGGFDTGLTVANTSQDPMGWGTAAQNGICTFTFYGGTTAAPTTPPHTVSTPNIAAGTVWADTLSDPLMAPAFQGYAFAVCNFQFAHGFAFISDVGARNLAMGYLALVIPDIGGRDPSPFGNGLGGGEQEAH